MDLWIRSQNRKILQKINKSYVCQYPNADGKYAIYDLPYPSGEYAELGVYNSQERALEVLDEIQNILKPKMITTFKSKPKYDKNHNFISDSIVSSEEIDYFRQLNTYVYEMPKE